MKIVSYYLKVGSVKTLILLFKDKIKVFGDSDVDLLGIKNKGIGVKNAYFWDIDFE